jgi:hypothetical protein
LGSCFDGTVGYFWLGIVEISKKKHCSGFFPAERKKKRFISSNLNMDQEKKNVVA